MYLKLGRIAIPGRSADLIVDNGDLLEILLILLLGVTDRWRYGRCEGVLLGFDSRSELLAYPDTVELLA